ncbi:flagellin [Rhodoplanes sp. TEM]|uniref:Flagellin n=1 Tax=Rhodoplanes tepidamans TaxID=200616 RepID=A0ABT5JB05_RHOTP|nr:MULTISPECIES: flagellin [Rhodoplanes]MDC7786777.1 flagellin [Rhodoplanes tepidamans]MDC7987457.1 flagellin [Rhodoplanes sp. TEM]MDQ0356332.1 flagellar hook-associated protein 3 FlgL [Rhodoplanes tepidamans]
MIGRVATFALSGKMIDTALRTQARNSELMLQQASGEISTDFGGLGSSSRRVLEMQTAITQSKAYAESATNAVSRIEIMYSSLTQMSDLLTTLQSSVTGATDAGTLDEGTIASLTTAMGEYLEEFAAQLNTQYEGRYLFSGSMIDTAPVDLDSYPAQSVPSSASFDYYKGNDEITSVRVSTEQVVEYGVTAESEAFEKALRAFSIMANLPSGTSSIDTDTLNEVLTLTKEAMSGVTTIQTKLSINANRLESVVDSQEAFQEQATSLESTLTDVDVAAAAAELSTRQTQLEAAYSAIAKIQSLSLADYLK